MGCLYEDRNGNCTLACNDSGEFVVSLEQQGSKDGICVVSDDEQPSDNCESYESDDSCFHCGADYNIEEECTCE